MQAAPDIKLLLGLRAGLCVFNAGNEVVAPFFNGSVPPVGSRIGLVEGDRRITGRSHSVLRIEFTATASRLLVSKGEPPMERTQISPSISSTRVRNARSNSILGCCQARLYLARTRIWNSRVTRNKARMFGVTKIGAVLRNKTGWLIEGEQGSL